MTDLFMLVEDTILEVAELHFPVAGGHKAWQHALEVVEGVVVEA